MKLFSHYEDNHINFADKGLRDPKKLFGALVVLIIAVIGARFLLHSFAASPYISLQLNGGSAAGCASTTSNIDASNGHVVQFGLCVPPSSIADNCSADATSALNNWFASLPANSTVNLPSNSCYLVSNSQSQMLNIQKTTGLTINGNGSTFKQIAYTSNTTQPVLTLQSNTNLNINNLTVYGPHSTNGQYAEGDYGVMMYANNGVTLNGVTVNEVDGDGLALYNNNGSNHNITVNKSTLENIGYHAITPEAVNGFTFENSTVTNGDIDAEVDYACTPPTTPLANCGTFDNPVFGMVNFTLNNNYFPNGLQLGDGEACMPVANWTIENNNVGSGGMILQFNTTYSLGLDELTGCGQASGLTITGNYGTGTSLHPCCGSGSPYLVIQGWKNVTVANNHLVFAPNIYTNGGPYADLWSDTNVVFKDNYLANEPWVYFSSAPSSWPANKNISECGNIYKEQQNLYKEAACAGG